MLEGCRPRSSLARGCSTRRPGLDAPGDLLFEDGAILDHGAGLGPPDGAEVVDAAGLCLAPGLVDLRAALGEPGAEHRETIASAAQAAAAGGITTLCALPDTDPALDDPALVQFVLRRGAETGCITLLPYAAATKAARARRWPSTACCERPAPSPSPTARARSAARG